MDIDSIYCPTCNRDHQRREHPVDCYVCHRPTYEVHGHCPGHDLPTPTSIGYGNPHATPLRLARRIP